MLAEVPGYVIERWRHYEQLEPFATERLEKQIAALTVLYHNMHVKAQDRLEPKDIYLAVTTEPPKEVTPEQRMQAEQSAARAAEAADKARRGVQ